MNSAVFISKTVEPTGLLADWCKTNNVRLESKSLLEFKPIDFNLPNDFDVVFIASPRAAYFLLERFKLDPKVKLACAGESTKKRVETYGYQVIFTSRESGKIDHESKRFADWVAGRKVFFPSSNRSKKSYSKYLLENQIQEAICYETILKPEIVEACDAYTFTSPSNVEAFLEYNKLPTNARIIAWGESTANHLAMNGVTPNKVLNQSSEEELIDYLKVIFN